MSRKFLLIVVVAVVTFAAACGGGGGEGSESGGAPTFLGVGTAPVGGAFFVVGGAIAAVLTENGVEYGWQATAEATKGSQENIRRLVRGELDLALSNSAISYFAVRGEGSWNEVHEIRAVATLAPNVALFIAPDGGNVRTLADLKGKRVYVGPAGAGFEQFVGPLLEAHGVSYDDFTPLNGTQASAVDMLSDGSASAAFLGGAVPTASITQAANSQAIRFVPFDPAVRDALVDRYSFFRPATIPAGTYKGQADEFSGLDVGSMHLITSADNDEELVYRLTRTLWEHRAGVVEKHPAGRAINEKNVVRDTGTPFHSGAIRFYREIGIWPDAP